MEIPLFPLPNLVLFPHIAVPLHIFEERYKLMINDCIDRSEVFGLVLLREAGEESEETIHRVGVTVRIIEVERLDQGQLNIVCEGEKRCRIHRFTQNAPFWKGAVELLEDSETYAAEALYDQAAELYRSVVHTIAALGGGQESEVVLPESAADLSYMISYTLDIDPEEKQKLLETDSTAERLRMLLAHLTETLRKLEQHRAMREVMSKVRHNGDLGMPGKDK